MKILDAYDDDMRPIGFRMELREWKPPLNFF
jgi:hypothetical protein